MFQNKAKTVAEYLDGLPSGQREAVSATRDLVRKHLPKGYVEEMNWGAITWVVPLSKFPDTYNGQPLTYAALASRKGGVSLYLMAVYGNTERAAAFKEAFKRDGKKLDMGQACVRFKTLDDLSLDGVKLAITTATPDEYIHWYVMSRAVRGPGGLGRAKKKPAAKAKRTPAKSK